MDKNYVWTRECQECGFIQKAVKPKEGELSNSYAYSKCRKCKSEALDYGKDRTIDTSTGKFKS